MRSNRLIPPFSLMVIHIAVLLLERLDEHTPHLLAACSTCFIRTRSSCCIFLQLLIQSWTLLLLTPILHQTDAWSRFITQSRARSRANVSTRLTLAQVECLASCFEQSGIERTVESNRDGMAAFHRLQHQRDLNLAASCRPSQALGPTVQALG